MGKLIDALQQKSERDSVNPELLDAKNILLREETKRLNCDVPISVYKKLQLKVIRNDTTISAAVNDWLLNYTQDN